jgi:hypothetical protein
LVEATLPRLTHLFCEEDLSLLQGTAPFTRLVALRLWPHEQLREVLAGGPSVEPPFNPERFPALQRLRVPMDAGSVTKYWAAALFAGLPALTHLSLLLLLSSTVPSIVPAAYQQLAQRAARHRTPLQQFALACHMCGDSDDFDLSHLCLAVECLAPVLTSFCFEGNAGAVADGRLVDISPLTRRLAARGAKLTRLLLINCSVAAGEADLIARGLPALQRLELRLFGGVEKDAPWLLRDSLMTLVSAGLRDGVQLCVSGECAAEALLSAGRQGIGRDAGTAAGQHEAKAPFRDWPRPEPLSKEDAQALCDSRNLVVRAEIDIDEPAGQVERQKPGQKQRLQPRERDALRRLKHARWERPSPPEDDYFEVSSPLFTACAASLG